MQVKVLSRIWNQGVFSNYVDKTRYSRVQKSWNEVFFKILEEPSIVQKKLIPHIKGLDFSQRWSKKNQAYVGQPHDHISRDISMPFASINSTNPRTNPWNFHDKIFRIGGAGKLAFCFVFWFLVLGLFKKHFLLFFCRKKP